MVKIDITNNNLPDSQFDCVLCCHVLEHIPDDEKAMRELFRILKPGGWAILQSPVGDNLDKTIEYPNTVSPEGHVRMYGKDYITRLERAGFLVKCDDFVKELSNDIIRKYGLVKDEIIYLCNKPKTAFTS